MPWTESRMNRTMGVLLRVGVVASAVVVLAGAVWYCLSTGGTAAAYHVFHGVLPELTSPTATVQAAFQGNPAAWSQLGLLILIATPVARVVYSAAVFALQRDWTFTIITLVVLAVLVYGLW
jgi:uncharacterized membrane protein